MGWKSRQEKEVRRLVALGRPVTATRQEADEKGRPYCITATLHKVGPQYHFLMDHYYLTGVTGETIKEEARTFVDLEEALRHLTQASGIQLYDFKP